MNNYSHSISASRIILSAHSKERAMQRLSITKVDELRKMAANARNKGVRHDSVNIYNYDRVGLNYREFCSFHNCAKRRNNSERIYLYKGYVWVFRGQNALNLVTVFKLDLMMNVPEVQVELRKNLNNII